MTRGSFKCKSPVRAGQSFKFPGDATRRRSDDVRGGIIGGMLVVKTVDGGATIRRTEALDKNFSKDFKRGLQLILDCMHAIMFMRYSTCQKGVLNYENLDRL